MNYIEVVNNLEAERSAIDAALNALKPLAAQTDTAIREVRHMSAPAVVDSSNDSAPRRRRRRLSADTRKKISESMKRHYQQKKTAA